MYYSYIGRVYDKEAEPKLAVQTQITQVEKIWRFSCNYLERTRSYISKIFDDPKQRSVHEKKMFEMWR